MIWMENSEIFYCGEEILGLYRAAKGRLWRLSSFITMNYINIMPELTVALLQVLLLNIFIGYPGKEPWYVSVDISGLWSRPVGVIFPRKVNTGQKNFLEKKKFV
jgi:hypothetical protein